MGLLKLLGLENEQKPDQALVDENAKLKADNLALMGRVSSLSDNLAQTKSLLEQVRAHRMEAGMECSKLVSVNEALKAKLSKRRKAKKSK